MSVCDLFPTAVINISCKQGNISFIPCINVCGIFEKPRVILFQTNEQEKEHVSERGKCCMSVSEVDLEVHRNVTNTCTHNGSSHNMRSDIWG